jgi:hypothetical protein
MKLRMFVLIVISLLFMLLIAIVPGLTQTNSYRAVINRFVDGRQFGQAIVGNSPRQLANNIYRQIPIPGKFISPKPSIKITLGTIKLDVFEKELSLNRISAKYYERKIAASPFLPIGKDNWLPIQVSSIQPVASRFRVDLFKEDYNTETQEFRVIKNEGGAPVLQFRSSFGSLMGTDKNKYMQYILDPGNSGIDPRQFSAYLSSLDQRWRFREDIDQLTAQWIQACLESNRKDSPINIQNPLRGKKCNEPNISVTLSRT